MISPEEVKQKAENWYKEVLQAEISGTVFFPKEIAQIGAFKQHEVVANLTEISRQFENLINKSKEKTGSGYRLEWEERNFRTIGKNRFINKIIFDCQLDYLKFLGREKDFNHFKKNVEKLLVDFPDLKHWVIQNPFRIIDNKLIWDNLILVLRYFKDNHIPNKYYIRELPIGIHTKFIEENKSVLYELLSIVFPPHLLKGEFFGLKEFEKRFGLKYNEPLIRLRILDKEISESFYSGISDFSVPESEFKLLDTKCRRVFIFENKTNFSNILNFLTLPQLTNTIAIFGSGFKVGLLKNCAWLEENELFYWGDLDVQGFQILSQLRGYFPKVKSFLMDMETFNTFQIHAGVGTVTKIKDPEYLSLEEKEVYNFLKQNNLRLEQEKIFHWYVVEEIKKLRLN